MGWVLAHALHLNIPFSSTPKATICVDAQCGHVRGISVSFATLEAIHMNESFESLFARDSYSGTSDEKTRKMITAILRRFGERGTQTGIAQALGVADSTIYRIFKDQDHLTMICSSLVQLGFKLVPDADFTVDQKAFEFTTTVVARVMADPEMSKKVLSASE